MNLRSVDLNLLVLLQALLEERHVSRAACRAGLSQPAMSNALDRCRRLFDDPLLERVGSVMRLTAKAEALREPLAKALEGMETLIDARPIGLDEIERTIGIALADALAAVLVVPLLAAVAKEAPGITLAFQGWSGGVKALDRLRVGTVDVAVSVLASASDRALRREPLMTEHYMLAGRVGHPALSGRDGKTWLDHPHVVVSAEGATRTPIDEILATHGLTRRVGVAVPSFLLVPDLLQGSDMLALLPSLTLAGWGNALQTAAPPVAVPGFDLAMAWHRRNDGDPALDFITSTIRKEVLRLYNERSPGG